MFKDKNGNELKIGDYIIPDDGIELLITEEKYMEIVGCDCLIGKQVPNPEFFSILTQENLSSQWSLVLDESEHPSASTYSVVQPIVMSDNEDASDADQGSEPSIYDPEPDRDLDWKEREKISAK